MDDTSLEYNEENDVENSDSQLPKKFPGFGKSWLWLILFFGIYFVGLALYFFGYGIVVGVQHAELAGTGELESLAQELIEKHSASAVGISGAYITMFFLLMPVLYMASKFKYQSWKDTLGIHRFAPKDLYVWFGILSVFFLIQMGVLGLIDPPLTEFTEVVVSSKSMLFAAVMIFFAPFLEELVFRGYLFKAWRHTFLGLSGTLVLTSLLFSALHFGQYHWSTMTFLFVLSLILGISREKTGSVLVPIILHSANNLAAIIVAYLAF